jgi:23S rRNA (pseudouridine1915-N3)-methyltransferase
MAARFVVLPVGKPRSKWAQTAVDDYTQRLRRHGGVREQAIKAETFRGDVDAVKQAEGKRMLEASSKMTLVVLDERGDCLNTSAFAKMVDQGRQQGTLAFAIGGAYGHDATVRSKAWKIVRLSDLVLNHALARVVLYEQLYRSMTLLSGAPYHH